MESRLKELKERLEIIETSGKMTICGEQISLSDYHELYRVGATLSFNCTAETINKKVYDIMTKLKFKTTQTTIGYKTEL